MHHLSTFIAPVLRRMRQSAHLEPSRDWLVIVILAIITLAGIIVWNAWAFDTISRGGVIGTSVKKPTPIFSQSSLEVIQTVFTNRATEEAKSVTGVYRYVDPSQLGR